MRPSPSFIPRAALAVALAVATAGCGEDAGGEPSPPDAPAPGDDDPSTYHQRVFYELWVRSFQDSDGDGIGDIPGLIDRLDELQDLGVGGIWLMPTFPSPLSDSGYDVADFRGVHPDYGTMEDMRRLFEEAHERDILVYLDMVFNHTSTQHSWFQSALNGPTDPRFDWYVWAADPSAIQCEDPVIGPFGTERWEYVTDLDMYYFHQFQPAQPDLNFDNPDVRAELLDILEHWMGNGADGFRFDVADRYFETATRCASVPETIAFHDQLGATIRGFEGAGRGFVSELPSDTATLTMYMGPEKDPMAFHFPFMFAMYTAVSSGMPSGAVSTLEQMEAARPEGSQFASILGNHDTRRFAEVVFGDPARQKLAGRVLLSLPPVPFIWMGDELGLEMGTEEVVDWRDGSRVPYPWTADGPGHAFTEGDPWLAFSPDAADKAYELQRQDPDSILSTFRRWIRMRNAEPALHSGSYERIALDGPLWVFERQADDDVLVVAHHFGGSGPASWQPTEDRAAVGYEDVITGERFGRGEPIELPARSSRVLRPR